MSEDSTQQPNVSKEMSLVLGAGRRPEWGHKKYVLYTI